MRKCTSKTRFVGLDVHAETIAVAVAEGGSRKGAESLGIIPNRAQSIRKLMKRLGRPEELRVCYEAGPCGYVVYWQLAELGVSCEVVAPTLIPTRSGDRIKTDRRDAIKLAQYYRAGELTSVWVPDAVHEALRDLVRAREAAKKDQLRARHRLGKFLLRQGRRPGFSGRKWTAPYMVWVETQTFELFAHQATFVDYLHEVIHAAERVKRLEQAIDEAIESAPAAQRELIAALQCLRGVAKLTAVSVVAEIGTFQRFQSARELMAYAGEVPSEHSSAGKVRRGGITKTGNSHLRRVLGEAAWSYRLRPNRGYPLRKRQEGQSERIKETAWKAQHRLHSRYCRLAAKGKPQQKVITAVARELLGFMWSIGNQKEAELGQR